MWETEQPSGRFQTSQSEICSTAGSRETLLPKSELHTRDVGKHIDTHISGRQSHLKINLNNFSETRLKIKGGGEEWASAGHSPLLQRAQACFRCYSSGFSRHGLKACSTTPAEKPIPWATRMGTSSDNIN